MSEVTLVLEDGDISIVGQAIDDAIRLNEKILARPDLALDDGSRIYAEEIIARYRDLQSKLNSQ